ncbi:MAG: histidine kinase dimerization/phospho-acceptor domain-containing protein, partial [Anaerolineae bacterium]
MTWFHNLRLGVKLSLVIVAALVGLVLFIFVALNVRALSLIDEVGQLRIDQEIQVIEHQFENTEVTLKSAATLLSNTSTFIQAVAEQAGERIYPIALTTLASFETDDFMVVGLDGAPLFNLHEEDTLLTSGPVSDMMNQTLFGVEHISLIAEESEPPLVHWVLTRPIRNENGEIIGGLLLAQELDSELLNAVNLGRAGVEIGLVYDGQLIAHSQTIDGAAPDTDAVLNTTELTQIAEAISSNTIVKTGTVYLSSGTPAVEAYMPLQAETDLAPRATVVIWVLNNEIANFRDNAIRSSGIALLLLLGLVIGAMLLQVNWLVIRPLERLRLSAVRFGRGDYGQRAEVKAQDEVGQLALTFNAMADNIERLVKVLEREIEVSEEARERAERSDQVKSSFLASMSHELRTPLNSIINFTKFVAKGTVGPVNEEQQQMLDDVIDSARHLLGLINDVLDMSKIESGSLKLFVEDNVDLNALLNAAVNTSRSLLIEKSVTLETAIDGHLPLLRADRQRILQVLLNLLSNACKFTEEGYIMVSASQRGDEVEISIQDTGPGIDEDEQTSVFEAFKQ